MSALRITSIALGILGALVACSTDPVNITQTGTITDSDPTHQADGSHYDEYRFTAKEGWEIEVTMESTEVDAYLQLRRDGVADETWLEEADDISMTDRNAKISITAPASGEYMVWANTAGSDERGAYSVHIRAEPPK